MPWFLAKGGWGLLDEWTPSEMRFSAHKQYCWHQFSNYLWQYSIFWNQSILKKHNKSYYFPRNVVNNTIENIVLHVFSQIIVHNNAQISNPKKGFWHKFILRKLLFNLNQTDLVSEQLTHLAIFLSRCQWTIEHSKKRPATLKNLSSWSICLSLF